MLSKANISFIKSLQVKKYRKQEQCFVVEGAKSVLELMRSDFEVVMVLATEGFAMDFNRYGKGEMFEVSEKQLSSLGEFRTNNTALAVARMKENKPLSLSGDEFGLVLDDIRDPGNLGTIIRTADWYGINKIIASPGTAELYNSKVITSTMGSFTRVDVFYIDLPEYFAKVRHKVFGAFLDGADVHQIDFGAGGLILIGSESHGISPELEKFISERITIPRYGNAESLNAAVATAIVCDNLRSRGR